MKKGIFVVSIAIFLIVSFTATYLFSYQSTTHKKDDNVKVVESYGKLPLSFIENKGQVDKRVAYYLKGKQGTIYFTTEGIVYNLLSARSTFSREGKKTSLPEDKTLSDYKRLSFSLKPVAANRSVKILPKNKLPGSVNYLIGNNQKNWHKQIPTYKEIVYKDLFKGIDLKVYGTNNQMEYDFVVSPGADPNDITMSFEGIDDLRVNKKGDLLIITPLGELRHLKPYIYQEIDGRRHVVKGSFFAANNTFSFRVGMYKKDYPLIIDPLTLSYSTYLGGGGNYCWEWGAGIAVDTSGNAYVVGNTDSTDFPLENAYQDSLVGGSDVFVTKLNSTGSILLYSTYLGGSSNDNGNGIAVDSSGNAYVTGRTSSRDFPLENPYQGSYGGSQDAFVTKLNPSGNSLVYSTYLGGNDDDSGEGIAVDSSGNAYVAGWTQSTDFPLENAYQDSLVGGINATDAFVTKLNPSGNSLAYSTYLGGSSDERGSSIAVDTSGNAYVTGRTSSRDFPLENAYQGSYGGTQDAFVTKLNPSGNSLAYSTYLGGSNDDWGLGIAVDTSGNAYVAGQTGSTDFPLENAYQGSFGGEGLYFVGDAFVTKFNSTGNILAYSTYLGGSNDDWGLGIAVDLSGNAYVTGFTGSTDFPLENAYQDAYGGVYSDAFVTKLNPSGNSLVYSTYLGGNDDDSGEGIAVDSSGNAYVAGSTLSIDFPLKNAYQCSYGGGEWDAFVTKFDSNLSPGPFTPPPSTHFGTKTTSGHAAEPVNTALGSYTYQHTDLGIPGRGVSLRFTRAYNSQDLYNGPLGYGWTHSYNIILTEDSGDGSVNIKWGDGHEDFYTSNGDGTYTPQYGGVYDVLIKNADDTFTLTRKDQTQYDFDTTGKLIGITDKNSNSIVLTYDGSDNLASITNTVGRDIDLTYDTNDRLIQITDPIARTIGYEYDVNGDLIKVTDANGAITSFEYDDAHRLTKIILPKENVLVDNTYDDQERVISQTNGRGFISTFDYNTPNDGDTTITDPLGYTTIHTHDSAYRLTQMTDANGDTIQYAYDANNNRTSITDKSGNVTYYTYDAMGNVTSKTDALGNVTTITYDSNNPTQRTDALGNSTTYGYDANGNLITTTDTLGNVRSITYNTSGQALTLTDANGHVTTNEYDAQGNLIKITDALGNITNFTFDGAGRRASATNANGNTTSFTYDTNDTILTITDPLGSTTAYTYDTNENRISVTDPNGNTTVYSYDENDLLTTITDPSGNVTTYTYNEVDNKTSTQDARGNTTQYSYDGIGNLIQIKDALNNTATYTYDGNGNLLTRNNALGNTTVFTYDALNRLIQTTDPLANTTQNSYDALGRMIQVTDAMGRVTQYSYDDLGRLMQVTDAIGGVTDYSYDNIGNRTSLTDAQGNTNSFAYDELNRLITKTDPLSNAQSYIYDGAGNRTTLTDANGNTIQYSYDGNSRLTDITYPDATAVTFTYDTNGNRTGMVDQYGTYTYQFDELDRMTSYIDGYGKTVSYSYDEAGNRTSLIYPDNKTVNYTYDPLNRMSTVTDWLGGTTIYTYDAAGNLANTNNPNGTAATNAYDNRNRLISIDNTKSDTSLISSYKFTLDSLGNRTQVIKNESLVPVFASADKSYSYNIDNRLLTSNGTAYNYDANGNMTSKASDTYAYDYEDRLSRTSIGGVNTRYQYDGVGNRIARIEDGVTTRYVLDISGLLSQVLAETDDSGTITNYYIYGLGLISKITPSNAASYYHYDSRGSTIALTDSTETITDTYAYDPFGKLANSEGFTANSFKYVGRFGVMGEGNGLNFMRARYYDPEIGRFITKDPLTGNDSDSQSLNRYVYALNNPVVLIDISGLSAKEGLNQFNHLASISASSASFTQQLKYFGKKTFEVTTKGVAEILGIVGSGVEGLGKFFEGVWAGKKIYKAGKVGEKWTEEDNRIKEIDKAYENNPRIRQNIDGILGRPWNQMTYEDKKYHLLEATAAAGGGYVSGFTVPRAMYEIEFK